MADYNVQMKQFNGTSFDNILPHAYLADNAEKLGGGGKTEIIAQARAGLSQFATGSYVGNGQTSVGTSISITFPFSPKIVFIFPFTEIPSLSNVAYEFPACLTNLANNINVYQNYRTHFAIWYEGLKRTPLVFGTRYRSGSFAQYDVSGNSMSWTVSSYGSGGFAAPQAKDIYNESKQTYHWVAFG